MDFLGCGEYLVLMGKTVLCVEEVEVRKMRGGDEFDW